MLQTQPDTNKAALDPLLMNEISEEILQAGS